MPTAALMQLRDTMREMELTGFAELREKQWELGRKVRAMLARHGVKSVAAEGFGAPGVVVSHTTDPDLHNARKFIALGLQTAGGVPLMCDEPADFRTFRVGLFGLDKLANVDATVKHLESALLQILEHGG